MNCVVVDMDVRMEVCLSQCDFVSVMVMKMLLLKWVLVGFFFGQCEEYWEFLVCMMVFLVIVKNEVYGFEYFEVFVVGVIGVFLDIIWVCKMVFEDYLYFYCISDEVVLMFKEVFNDLQIVCNVINEFVGGLICDWIFEYNQCFGGNEVMCKQIEEWFFEIQV